MLRHSHSGPRSCAEVGIVAEGVLRVDTVFGLYKSDLSAWFHRFLDARTGGPLNSHSGGQQEGAEPPSDCPRLDVLIWETSAPSPARFRRLR